MCVFHLYKLINAVYYLDSRLFPEEGNGPTDLYEGRDSVVQENDLFKTTETSSLPSDRELNVVVTVTMPASVRPLETRNINVEVMDVQQLRFSFSSCFWF